MGFTLGIRREDKSVWERRVPLVPADIAMLGAMHSVRAIMQPSSIRAFHDAEYQRTGAEVSEDLSACDLVMGVKEMPLEFFRKNGSYLFFSHTVKGQPHNMPMLARLAELGCTLLDYERIVDDDGRRLVFFGRHAGLAGMIDTLWALGARLESQGVTTPLSRIRKAHEYPSLEAAKLAIRLIGGEIAKHGLPAGLAPAVIGFAGYGNVSRGAQEIFDLLPHREVTPEELLHLDVTNAATDDTRRFIKVVFREEHTVRPAAAGTPFDKNHYFAHPEQYVTNFRQYAEKLSILVNCIYWTPQCPRLLSCADARAMWGAGRTPKLMIVGDISCDIDGGIEFTVKATQPDYPVFVYDPDTATSQDGVRGHGPIVMAVDNLPCELSTEASQEFSQALMPLMPELCTLDTAKPFADCTLPAPLRRAVILWRGEFTPDYAFMRAFLEK